MTDRSPITINGRTWVYDPSSRTHKPASSTAAGDHAACPAADVEPAARDGALAEKKGARFDTPVSITIISHRVRLTDADNCSAKAAIDGLVHCGILRDDGPAEVAEVRYRQVKVKNREEEKTVIEIEAV